MCVRPQACYTLKFPFLAESKLPWRNTRLIRGVTGCCLYQLRKICAIRKSLTVETAKLLVHAFVNSRLDHCNSVLQGISAVNLQKLQVVQNCAARIVVRKRKFDPITSTMRDELHWLPIALQAVHACLQKSTRHGSIVYCGHVYETLFRI